LGREGSSLYQRGKKRLDISWEKKNLASPVGKSMSCIRLRWFSVAKVKGANRKEGKKQHPYTWGRGKHLVDGSEKKQKRRFPWRSERQRQQGAGLFKRRKGREVLRQEGGRSFPAQEMASLLKKEMSSCHGERGGRKPIPCSKERREKNFKTPEKKNAVTLLQSIDFSSRRGKKTPWRKRERAWTLRTERKPIHRTR